MEIKEGAQEDAEYEDLSLQKQHIEEGNQVTQLLKSVIRKLKDPFFYTGLLNLIGQAAPAGIQIQAGITQIQLTKIQIDLTNIMTNAQAVLELISQLLPGFDASIQSLQQDTTNMMKFMMSLLTPLSR